MAYPRVSRFHTPGEFREHLRQIDALVPLDDAPLSAAEGSPPAAPFYVGGRRVGNRWCMHPMEGWDGTPDGRPSELTLRRWRHFGRSGAKLIWGGEAFAVRDDGRANPNQLFYRPENAGAMADLLAALRRAHVARFGADADADLLVGLQLTHSGRFSRPHAGRGLVPRIAYHHPVLDARCGIDPSDASVVMTDDAVRRLTDDFVAAARMAQNVGFDFVDVKACHGYLGHEFLSAYARCGRYGGDLAGRSRWLRETIDAVRGECPGLMVGVRLSLFDVPPFRPDPSFCPPAGREGELGPGVVQEFPLPYPGFGCNRRSPLELDLSEPIALVRQLHEQHGVAMVNLTAGSPYYNPHVQRPAFFPPSDGYQPPENPLVGCARQIAAAGEVKRSLPEVPLVGTAYTCFQEFLPHVAQAVVRQRWIDFVGVGRLALSYWDLPADVLAGRPIDARRLCRTLSDCTTGPRNGLPSGCYPLDPFYRDRDDAKRLLQVKAARRGT
jgi:NADPH2 dehydrogenase